MRIMALDVGDKTIGLAVTDEMVWTAQGIGTIRRRGREKDIEEISKYITDYNVEKIVVGLPLRGDDGEIGIQAKKVLRFVDELKKGLKEIEIETWDESMTTHEAHEILAKGGVSSKKRKKVVDKLAAVFILESYMRYSG